MFGMDVLWIMNPCNRSAFRTPAVVLGGCWTQFLTCKAAVSVLQTRAGHTSSALFLKEKFNKTRTFKIDIRVLKEQQALTWNTKDWLVACCRWYPFRSYVLEEINNLINSFVHSLQLQWRRLWVEWWWLEWVMPTCPVLVVHVVVMVELAGGVAMKLHRPGGASAGELANVVLPWGNCSCSAGSPKVLAWNSLTATYEQVQLSRLSSVGTNWNRCVQVWTYMALIELNFMQL